MLVVIEPTGHYAYVSASTGSGVYGYSIDQASGALTALSGSPFPAGTNPLFINIDPSGKFAYTANNSSGGISGYAINPQTGVLTAITGSPFPTGQQPFVVSISPELPGIRD
jgi:6-phosphogluconolactonase (cycloisomerase 2 family)